MRKTGIPNNRGRTVTRNKGALNKAASDGNLTKDHKMFLGSNGINPKNGAPLGMMKVLLVSKDENGELVSRFDGIRIGSNRVTETPVNENELWVCVADTEANNSVIAQPLYRINSEDIVGLNGKTETLAEFMWKNRPEEILKHLDLSEDVARFDEINADFKNLKRECERLKSQIGNKIDGEKTLRKELEKEFRKSEKKLVDEHKTVLSELTAEYSRKEKQNLAEIEDLTDRIHEIENGSDGKEVQILKDKITRLTERNGLLEEQIKREKAEMEQKTEELTTKNMTDSSYYEGVIENLNKDLNGYKSDSEFQAERCKHLTDEINRLTEKNESLEDLVKAKNSEMEQRVEELRTANRTGHDHYEAKIDELEVELNRYRNEAEMLRVKMNSNRISEISDIPEHDDETVNNLRRELDSVKSEHRIALSKLTEARVEINNLLCETRKSTIQSRLEPLSGSVIRISADEFKCSLIDEGTYTVKINADGTVMRFVPDAYGVAECRNGIIHVPHLNRIEVLGNRFGKFNWRMVNGNTLEVSI